MGSGQVFSSLVTKLGLGCFLCTAQIGTKRIKLFERKVELFSYPLI